MATTQNYALPYPGVGDAVKPASRDFRDLALKTDAALTLVSAGTGTSWPRRAIESGEDVLLLGPGVYSLTAAAVWDAVNLPERVVGVIVVEGLPGAPDQTVRYMPRGKKHVWENRRDTNTTWRGWEQGVTVDRGVRGIIPNGTDIDSMRGEAWAGTWDTPGAGANLDSLGGTWPLINGQRIPRLAIISVSGTLSTLGNMGYQTMALLASGNLAQTQYLIRFNQGYNRTGPEAWTEWVRLDTPDLTGEVEDLDSRLSAVEAGSGVGLPTNALATGGREMRLQMFRDAYPLVSTGGKGAVVFRYDHGLTNFKNVLLPLHEQYGIVPYIAMNSRNWDLPENSGATQAEARAWNVEWGNHSADHNDKTGIEDIYEAVALGRIELEAQVGKTVHGWTVPGLPGSDGNSYDKLDGFGVGYASGYSNSYAGSLILNHHAIASGIVGPQYRPLDGEIRQGGRHIGWENRAWDGPDGIKALIDEAVATKTALTLMQHPRTMNLSGYWTPALAEQVLAYVRSLIDAGDLANISYYQSHHAQLAPLPAQVYVSGLRDVSGELLNGWTGTLFVERDGRNVYFRGTLNGGAATSDIAWMLPAGFRPGTVQTAGGPIDYGTGVAVINDAVSGVYQINHYLNRFQIRGGNGQAKNIGINHQLRTSDAAPTTLPGVPA